MNNLTADLYTLILMDEWDLHDFKHVILLVDLLRSA